MVVYSICEGGSQSAELIPYGDRPVTVHTDFNMNTVAVTIREKGHSLTCKLAKLLNISRTSVNRILTKNLKNLARRRVSLVWVPHFLTNTQMDDCVARCQNLSVIKDIPDFLNCVITCDKSWAHYFDPKSKQESSH